MELPIPVLSDQLGPLFTSLQVLFQMKALVDLGDLAPVHLVQPGRGRVRLESASSHCSSSLRFVIKKQQISIPSISN